MSDPAFPIASFRHGYSAKREDYEPRTVDDGTEHMLVGASAVKSRVVGEATRGWKVVLPLVLASELPAWNTFYGTTVNRSVTPFTWTNPWTDESDIRVKFSAESPPRVISIDGYGHYYRIEMELVEYLGV